MAVTGGAGFSADAIKVFGNINSTLLLWSVIIVAILLLITYRSPFLWLVPLICVPSPTTSRAASRTGWRRPGS